MSATDKTSTSTLSLLKRNTHSKTREAEKKKTRELRGGSQNFPLHNKLNINSIPSQKLKGPECRNSSIYWKLFGQFLISASLNLLGYCKQKMPRI